MIKIFLGGWAKLLKKWSELNFNECITVLAHIRLYYGLH